MIPSSNISVVKGPLSKLFCEGDEIDVYHPAKNMSMPPEIFTIVHPYLSLDDISSLALTNHEVNRWIGMNDVIREYHLVKDSNDLVIASCKNGYINLLMYLHRTKKVITDDALKWASQCGHLPIVEYLCNVGANPTANNNCAIRWASSHGHLPVVKYLHSVGADPTTMDHSLITWASQSGHLDLVKYLHSAGVEPTADDNGPIKWASACGQLDVVKYLHSVGANLNTGINKPILCASANGQLDVVKYLCTVGADPTADDNEALKAAHKMGHRHVVEYLCSVGAGSVWDRWGFYVSTFF